jgi:outer membrane protein TolC
MDSATHAGTTLALAVALGASTAWAQPALTLRDAVERAVRRDERAAIAGTRLEEAEARLGRARAFFFPELTLTASYLHRDDEVVRAVGDTQVTIQARDALSGVASLRLHVFDARAFPGLAAARLSRRASELDLADTRRRVAFDAADAFLLVLNLGRVTQAAERRRDLARTTLADARARVGAGLVGANDATKAELELATSQREVVRAGADLAAARLALEYYVGARTPRELADPGALDAGPGGGPAQGDRLDAAAARTRAESARRQAAAPLWSAVPRVDVSANLRATNESGFSGRDTNAWVGADLTWEIFDGGERYAERDEHLAAARAASLEARALERGARLRAAQAGSALEAADAAVAEAQRAAEIAERNARETSVLYREGLATALDVADAAARWYDAEVSLVRERYGRTAAVLALRDARGLDPLGREVRP